MKKIIPISAIILALSFNSNAKSASTLSSSLFAKQTFTVGSYKCSETTTYDYTGAKVATTTNYCDSDTGRIVKTHVTYYY